MTYEDDRSARDAEAEARAQADSQLAASLTFMNDHIASAEFEPRQSWLERALPEKHRWFLWLWLGAAFWFAAIIEIGR